MVAIASTFRPIVLIAENVVIHVNQARYVQAEHVNLAAKWVWSTAVETVLMSSQTALTADFAEKPATQAKYVPKGTVN